MSSATTMNNTQKEASRVPSPPLNYDYSVITSDTDPAATLLLDAKNEYNKQLISHLRQPVFNLMKTIYNTSEDICHQENTPENVLMVFQDNLAQVPKWTKPRRTKEYDEFLKISKCDWFNELIKFCYITHVKILTIVNKPRPDVKLSISIPSGSAFFHSVCITVARELWRSPFLFNKNVGGKYEYQKNMRVIEQIIDNSVDTCIRAHIPMKAILMEYLDNDVSLLSTSQQEQKQQSQHQAQSTQDQQEIKPVKPDTNTKNLNNDNSPTLIVPSDISSRISKPNKLKISDELDTFLDTPLEAKDELEPVIFTKPDDLVDELEIIEPTINDDESGTNPATPINILDNDIVVDELSEVILAPPQNANIANSTEQPSTTTTSNPEPDIENKTAADTSAQKADTSAPKADTSAPKADPLVSNSNEKDEFDLDSLPEISIASLTQIAEPDKPTTPEPPIDNQSQEQTVKSDVKHIPLTDMNEPGQHHLELKQPVPKKKLIVSDLDIEDLDEVPLADKLNEMRTFKQPTTLQNQKTMQPTTKQDFAFF